MSRFFMIMLLCLLVVVLIKRKKLNDKPNTTSNEANKSAENMVKCEQCGVHLPISEAISKNQHFYCCESHLPLQ